MTTGLRRFLAPPQAENAGEQPTIHSCEMCGVPSGAEHGHVVDLTSRGILCTCRPCYLLFTRKTSGGGRYRAIPDRHRYTADFHLDTATWETMGIPVRMAFFFRNSQADSTVAFYPSPAGATECLLPLDQWQDVVAANPEFTDVEEDVEALLINREDDRFECFLVPVDACYQLVGIVKMNWRGFDGGTEAWAEIDAFFTDLRERSEHAHG
ncbi:MAG: DUF5947 family protein [Sciscionella sp.]